jgi:hypothetical protein
MEEALQQSWLERSPALGPKFKTVATMFIGLAPIQLEEFDCDLLFGVLWGVKSGQIATGS